MDPLKPVQPIPGPNTEIHADRVKVAELQVQATDKVAGAVSGLEPALAGQFVEAAKANDIAKGAAETGTKAAASLEAIAGAFSKKEDIATAFFRMLKGEKGDDAPMPSDEQLLALIRPLIPAPLKGDKGDSVKGDKGDSPTEDELLSLIRPLIPKVRDGKTPTKEELISIIQPLIPKPIEGKKGDKGEDGNKATAEEIVAKIRGKIRYEDIADLPDIDGYFQRISSKDYDLGELRNVVLTSPTNDQVIKYDAATGKWVNGTASGGASAFIDLTDVPNSYSGQGGKAVRVNAGETGLEFFAAAGSGTVTDVASADGSVTVTNGTTTPDLAVVKIAVANEGTDATCFPLFATAATGVLGPKTNAALTYNSATGALASTSFVGALTGNVTGNLTGDVTGNVSGSSGSTTGNAATATALQNARTIGGVSFNGTANITVATATGGFTVSGGALALGTNDLTMTGSLGTTGARVTKVWTAALESTAMPTVGGVAILTSLTAPQFTTIELGHATDTTLARVSAGVVSIEGVNILTTATGQPLDATLTALAAYNTNGLLTQTAADTFTGRTLTGTAAQITVSNGDGVSGNPTLSLPSDVLIPTVLTVPNTGLHLLDTNASHDLIVKPGSDLSADRTLTITTGDTDMIVNLTAVTDEFILAYDAGTNTWRGVANSGGSGASTALDNLAAVAINAALVLATSDAFALGSATKQWSDLFLAEGGVINWDNGDATITQTANDITIAGITTFGVGTSTAVTLGTIELGHASDTTIARVSAGVASLEGVNLVTVSSTDTLTNKTLTAPKFADLGYIADANGNELLILDTVASAVNEVTFSNAATGNDPNFAATGGDTNVGVKITTKGTGKIGLVGSVNHGDFNVYFTEHDDGNSSTTDTIDWTLSNKHKSTLTGNCTFTFTAPNGPCNLVLKLVQDGTGSRTVTWPSTVHWPAGTAPTLTTTAGKVDIVTFYWDGTTYFGAFGLNYTA